MGLGRPSSGAFWSLMLVKPDRKACLALSLDGPLWVILSPPETQEGPPPKMTRKVIQILSNNDSKNDPANQPKCTNVKPLVGGQNEDPRKCKLLWF